MKIGITGATGFIGKNLVNKIVDSTSHQVSVFCKEESVNFPKSVKVFKGDLVENFGLQDFVSDCDLIIHLAGRALPPDESIIKENVDATFNLMNALSLSKVKHFIYISSIAVYGNEYGKVATEKLTPKPNTLYGFAKYLSEEIVKFYSKNLKIESTILRPFNMYGPGNYKGIIFDFYKSYVVDGKFTLYGNGMQSRDFLFVSDVVDLMMKVISVKPVGIYNVGSGYIYTINDVAKTFSKVLGKKIDFDYQPSQSGKVYNINYSIEKIKRKLKWKANHNLEQGLLKTINWYEKNIDSNSL